MPEASVAEDGDLQAREHKISAAAKSLQRGQVDAVAEPSPVQ
jgi:hypothetical protein